YDQTQRVLELVLVDKKMLIGGLAMVIVGIILTVSISASMPAGQVGMSEEEVYDLMVAQQEIRDYNTLSGILIGVGFLLVLISFGARRKKGSVKKVEKKSAE
ncbi:MAG: hypothetical protein QQN50_07115, partial [Nitrosopumilus sp.]